MVIYLPVKSEFAIGQPVFELESGNRNFDGQTNGQKKDKRTDGWNFDTNFEMNLAVMVIYLPVKFEFNRTKHF